MIDGVSGAAGAPSRKTKGWRIGIVLLAVATVPLAGVVTVTFDSVLEAREARVAALSTGRLAEEAAGLVRLHGAVFDEMVA